jgi:hypothetical protein
MSTKKEFDLIQIFAGTTLQAEMVKSLLQDMGIETFLKDEHMGTWFPFHTAPGAAGSVKVVVANRDYEKAKAVVDEYIKNINTSE